MKREAVNNTKLLKLCRLLGVKRYAAVGMLEMLWHLTAREAPQGNVGKLSDEDIAAWMDWEGDSAQLVAAMVESRWLDASADHRLLVHDWHEHADDATKKKLARLGVGFLSGFVETCPDNGGQRRKVSEHVCPPEPEPEPEPVPEPESKPGKPSATPTSAGSRGEFAMAVELLRQLRLASGVNDVQTVAQVIQYTAMDQGDEFKAFEFLLTEAAAATARGEPVDIFWLKDKKWRPEYRRRGGNGNRSEQRAQGNREAARRVAASMGIEIVAGTG